MKTTLLLFVCLCFSTAFGQAVSVIYGVPYVLTTIGREIKQIDAAHRTKQQQQELDDNYTAAVFYADKLMSEKKYEDAINSYNEALTLKQQEQYPRDQIAKAVEEIQRLKDLQYQQVIYNADSLYNEMKYTEAIAEYQKALTLKTIQYPQDQLAKSHQGLYRLGKVQFSGLLISDYYNDSLCSKACAGDVFSDFISPGEYDYTENSLIYSSYQALDGIAVPANTRLIVYSQPCFKGKVLLDITGPAIVNNITKQKDPKAKANQTKNYTPAALQKMYPPTVRVWSQTDMDTWTKGSFEVLSVASF